MPTTDEQTPSDAWRAQGHLQNLLGTADNTDLVILEVRGIQVQVYTDTPSALACLT
jgi:hypothetical protein